MTPTQFTAALAATRMDPSGLATQAARHVLVDGMSRNAAAKQTGIDIRAVSRAVERIAPRQRCQHCGHLL